MADSQRKQDSITVGPRTFNIQGTLGKGGFSIVKKGVDSETRKRVALKIMFVECDQNDIAYQQTCHEIKIMRAINNPCVIRLLGYDLHSNYQGKNCVILVQELAPHCELFDYLMHTKKTFSEQLVMYVMNSLFDAIGYMHSQGIAHRDLKPENLLLDKDFNIKVADFGFATYFYKKEQRQTLTTELGTRGYMAPEISNHVYNEKCDSFALGVIMFICAAGFPPFRETKDSDWWFEKIMTQQWPLFWAAHERKAKFSNQCKGLIQALLCASPTDRVSVTEAKKDPFLTANTTGPLMDKTDYMSEMKQRYRIVKEALKAAKAQGAQRDENNMASKGDYFDQILANQSFIPTDVLCGNEHRNAIGAASNLDDLAQAISAMMPAQSTEHEVGNFQDAKQAIEGYILDDVKTAFQDCTSIDDVKPLLPPNANFISIWAAMNQKLLNDHVTVNRPTLAQYAELDNIDLVEVDNESLETMANAYKVKFGFGALVHMMTHFHKQIIDSGREEIPINVDTSKPACTAVFPITENREMPDGAVLQIRENLHLQIQMMRSEEGNNVLVFSMPGHTMYGEAFQQCLDTILTNTDILKDELAL